MGLTKDYMERLGGGNPDACLGRPVCANCFGDEGLAQIVEGSATSNRCDFCETESDEVIAADLFDVMEHVVEVLSFHYSTAENELPYESAEGGYQGQWWNTMELVQEVLALELPNDENGELLEAIVDSLPDNSWCENNPFSLTHGERLRFSWEEFCRCLKHERRFLFLLATDAEDADDGVPHSEEIFPPR
jgi:hypothetical protein